MLPLLKKRVKHSIKSPWISKEIDNEIYKRESLLSSKDKWEIQQQTNKVNSMKRKAKTKYVRDLISSSQNTKSVWKAIKLLTNTNSNNQNPINEISPEDINSHFTNVANNIILNDKSNENGLPELQEFCQSKNITSSLSIPPISVKEVENELLHLKQSGSRDLDGMDGKILKTATFAIA